MTSGCHCFQPLGINANPGLAHQQHRVRKGIARVGVAPCATTITRNRVSLFTAPSRSRYALLATTEWSRPEYVPWRAACVLSAGMQAARQGTYSGRDHSVVARSAYRDRDGAEYVPWRAACVLSAGMRHAKEH